MADVIISRPELISVVISTLTRKGKYDEEKMTPDFIGGYVDEVSQGVKNYCMIPNILMPMKYIVANICTDYILYDNELAKDINIDELDIDPADLSSIKIGDLNIGLGDKYRSNMRKTFLNAHDFDLDKLILDYKSQLNRFRRIW